MMKRFTLRTQLTIVYSGALLLGLVLFAIVSLAVLDRTARTTLDQRLISDANAVAAVTNVKHGRIKVDADDIAQFSQIIGVTAEGAIVASNGSVLVTSLSPLPATLREFAPANGTAARAGTIEYGSAALRVTTLPVGSHGTRYGYIVIWRSLDDIQGLDRRAGLIFALTIPLICAFAVTFGGVVAARGLRPLSKLAALASDIEARDLSRRLRVPEADDELSALCSTIDRMLDRLEAAFERERRFTSDASHEIRSPLTVLRAEAELSLRKDRDQAEYRRTLEAILREADRLESLTTDLLATARAEDAADSVLPVDMSFVVRDACASLGSVAESRGVSVATDIGDAVCVNAESRNLRRVVVAVLENAIKYSPAGGIIAVDLVQCHGRARLRIADRGPGFSSESLTHAFERFWRDTNGRSGTGLGLSIAQRIVHAYDGTITLSNDGGAVVHISFTCC